VKKKPCQRARGRVWGAKRSRKMVGAKEKGDPDDKIKSRNQKRVPALRNHEKQEPNQNRGVGSTKGGEKCKKK